MEAKDIQELVDFALQNAGKVGLIVAGIVTPLTAALGWYHKREQKRLKAEADQLTAEATRLRADTAQAAAERDRLRTESQAAIAARQVAEDARRASDGKLAQLKELVSRNPLAAGAPFDLTSLLSDQPVPPDGGRLLFQGKLALPPLPADWVQVSHSDGTPGRYGGGDLGLFQRLASARWNDIETSLQRTLAFNDARPPNIWITESALSGSRTGWEVPYIQVSLISRADAIDLMTAVRDDILGIGRRVSAGFEALKEGAAIEYTVPGQAPQPNLEAFVERLKRVVDEGGCEDLLQATALRTDTLTLRVSNIDRLRQASQSFEQLMALGFGYPLTMLGNCISSLGKLRPESGLLIGRLLYYVFGVARGSSIDVPYLTTSYDGSFARIVATSGDLVTQDHVLVLASKDNFCLVHVHVPLIGDRERELDAHAQAWIKAVRVKR